MIKNLNLASVIFVFSASETNNEVGVDDVTQNHVTDSLSPDVFPNTVDSDFSLSSSPFNSLDRPTAHTEDGGHEHLGNNLNVDGFLENHEESGSKEQNTDESLTISSPSKGKKPVHCRSSREINIELRAQIMKEIRKPGRSKYTEFLPDNWRELNKEFMLVHYFRNVLDHESEAK